MLPQTAVAFARRSIQGVVTDERSANRAAGTGLHHVATFPVDGASVVALENGVGKVEEGASRFGHRVRGMGSIPYDGTKPSGSVSLMCWCKTAQTGWAIDPAAKPILRQRTTMCVAAATASRSS